MRNWYAPSNVESIRDSANRAFDSEARDSQFVELIDKHGKHDLLEPIIDKAGPYAQLQLGDLANLLEVLQNFYHWRSPRKTFASLSFFACCLAVTLFADMAFCVKIVWFIVGGTYFLCWPIASLYPQYRYLVSPIKWVFWDVPTQAEWSFQYLRRQAQVHREIRIMKNVEATYNNEVTNSTITEYPGRIDTVPAIVIGDDASKRSDDTSSEDDWCSVSSTAGILEGSNIGSFRGFFGGSIGRLIVSFDGVCFVHSLTKAQAWSFLYIELAELRKSVGSRITKVITSPDRLEIATVSGIDVIVEGMKERDEAFNAIIAFSALQWQSLQVREASSEKRR